MQVKEKPETILDEILVGPKRTSYSTEDPSIYFSHQDPSCDYICCECLYPRCRDSYGYLNDRRARHPGFLKHLRKNGWATQDGELRGQGTFSLVKTRLGCSDYETYLYCAKQYGISFAERKFIHRQSHKEKEFIPNSTFYRADNHDSLLTDALGPPQNFFHIYTDYSQYSFSIWQWQFGEEEIVLFRTLTLNKMTGAIEWNFMSPPFKFMIYNKDLILRDVGKEIHIHDSIARADISNTSDSVGTWSGYLGLSDKLDWGFLKGRDVTYIFDNTKSDSLEIGAQLIEVFDKMNTPLKLNHISNNRMMLQEENK